jgi:hypothetical protein
MTVTLLLSGRAKNDAKRVTFRLSGRASRAIYATNEAIGIFGHTWTAHKGLVKRVTSEAKGHALKGPKVRSKKYSTAFSSIACCDMTETCSVITYQGKLNRGKHTLVTLFSR